jgi:putative inorganic carbon (hco3(-)) transporter
MNQDRIVRLCDWAIVAGVLLYALVLPFERHTESLKDIGVYLPLAAWIAKMARQRTVSIRRTPLDFAVIAYLLVCVLTAAFSIDPRVSFKIFLKEPFPSFLMFFAVVGNFADRRKLEWLWRAFLLSGLAVCVYGASGYVLACCKGAIADGRIQSSFDQPNRLAQYLLILASLAICRAAIGRTLFKRIGLFAFLLLVLYCLFATYSRAGWMAFVPTVMVYALKANRRGKIAIAAGCGLLLVGVFFTKSGFQRISTDFGGGERGLIYRSALNVFKDHPVLGAGYGDKIFLKVYREKYKSSEARDDHSGAHNIFLQVAVESGILGLIVFVWLHLKTAWSLIQAYRRTARDDLGWIVLWGLSSLVAVFTIGQLHTLYRDRNIGIFWLVMGIVFAAIQAERDNRWKASADSAGPA